MDENQIELELGNFLLPKMVGAVLRHLRDNDVAEWWSYRRKILRAMNTVRPWPGRPIIHLAGDPRLN